MGILKEISELINEGIISKEIAEKIKNYYKNKDDNSANRLFVIFGVLGSILVGLGIILIIAHNWDELSRATKTSFAFIPLIAGQLLAGFSLFKKQNNTAWREASSAFLFFMIGASISLISQIYNIVGNLSGFLLIWMLLAIPLVYIMKSSITSLLYIAAITYYAVESGYSYYHPSLFNYYWILLVLILPNYYLLYKRSPKSNYFTFHNWLIPISLIISLGIISHNFEELLFVAYISLFGLFYLIGNTDFFSNNKLFNNSFKILGSLGTISLLLTFSFEWFWKDLRDPNFILDGVYSSPEFIVSVIISFIAVYLLFKQIKQRNIKPISFVFILFFLIFFLNISYSLSVILINIIVFAIGVLTIREGAGQNHLGILNYGLLVITSLIICRFFDVDLSFIFRGLLFIFVGVGFFVANYLILKKRK